MALAGGLASFTERRAEKPSAPASSRLRLSLAANGIVTGVLLLVTGASGAGKSTVRAMVAPALAPEVECIELGQVAPEGMPWTLEWRQRGAEAAVRLAVELQESGRHLLLAGDPVAAVEIAATPSAPELEGFGFCLLDISADAQAARLESRGDPSELIPHHQAFAKWMRAQATNPLHMVEVVKKDAWAKMRWDRLPALTTVWVGHVIDVSALSPTQVAGAVLDWCRCTLADPTTQLQIGGERNPTTQLQFGCRGNGSSKDPPC